MTKEEQRIEEILIKVKECIRTHRITVGPKERQKNLAFLQQYLIEPKERFKLLGELTTKNFCEEILEQLKDSPEFDEHIYVFGLEKCLKERLTGKNRNVKIYIKFQFMKMKDDDNDYTLLISFHEEEKPLKYMFKK